MMNTANPRTTSFVGRQRIEALLRGCNRAFALVVLFVFLAVTLWLPAISANEEKVGVTWVDGTGRVEFFDKVPSQAGLVQGTVGVCSVYNHNYCITSEADFGEWCRLVQWTSSSRFQSRTGAICLNLILRRGKEMPSIAGSLPFSNMLGGVFSQDRDDISSRESVFAMPRGSLGERETLTGRVFVPRTLGLRV